MKRLITSLHFTRWLRVVAVAGVVWASAASADKAPAMDGYSATSSRTANSWCSRC